jgi:hypothetical protein
MERPTLWDLGEGNVEGGLFYWVTWTIYKEKFWKRIFILMGLVGDQVGNAAIGDFERNVLIWFIKRNYFFGNRDVCKMKPVKGLLPL